MRNLMTTCGIGVVLATFGCDGGGGSSIDENKVVSTMSDAEITALCNDARAEFGTRTVNCGDGVMVTVGITAEECTSNQFITKEGCAATAGAVLDCAAAFDAQTDAQFCSGSGAPPSGCSAAVVACIGGQ